MKANVDLTENRVFTTFEEPTDDLIIAIFKSLEIKKPWDFVNNPKKFTDVTSDANFSNARSLIPLGDKKEREILEILTLKKSCSII